MMKQISQLLYTLLNANALLAYAHIALFAIIFVATFLLIRYLVDHKWIESKIAKLSAVSKKQEELREEEYRKRALFEGEFKDNSKYYRINKFIQEAGLKEKYPELTVKGFILMIIAYCLIGGIIVWIISNSFLAAAIAVIAVFGFLIVKYQIKINKNYLNTENEIVKFINILDNITASEPTIGEMLNKTSQFLKEPLKSSVEQCYFDIKSNGNTELALKNMADRTSHKKLKEIINSLRVCSTHNENYAEVIEDNRESVRSYIMYQRQKRAILKNALFETVVLAIAGAIVIYMISTMVDNATDIIFHTLPGQIIMIMLAAIVLFELIKMFKQEDK